MNVTTCGMCNQIKSYGSGCGCRTVKKCKTPVASIMVNGQVSNQETIEFLGGCIDSQVVQDGCGHKLQLSFPCVSYNKDTQILTVEQGGELCEIDLSTLGDMDVYVNQGMFDGSNLLLTDTNSNTITVDISSLASSYTQNADGSITLTSGNGVDEVTIPAPFVHTPSSYTQNADGTITLDNGAGQTIDLPAQAVSAYSFNANGDLILDNGVDTPTVVPLGCCNTTVSVDANNNLVIEQDGGDDVTFDLTPVLNAQNITYDNSAGDNPADNVQSAIDWLNAQICADPKFTVNAGTTVSATDDSLGTEDVNCGDTLHFWSPNSTINFSVTPGSVVVAADVDVAAILSGDAGNTAVIGTDGGIMVPSFVPTVEDANNGVSLNGTTVVLGNDVGGTAAQLLNDREIPLNGNDVIYNGSTQNTTINSVGQTVIRRDDNTFQTLIDASLTRVQDLSNGYYAQLSPNALTFTRPGQNYIFANQPGSEIYLSAGGNNPFAAINNSLVIDTNNSFSVGQGLTTVAPSPTGNGSKVYLQGEAGFRDTVIDSGLDDYSGLVLSRLDENSPKLNYSEAFKLGQRNGGQEIVPIDFTEVQYQWLGNLNIDIDISTLTPIVSNPTQVIYEVVTPMQNVDIEIPYPAPTGYRWLATLEGIFEQFRISPDEVFGDGYTIFSHTMEVNGTELGYGNLSKRVGGLFNHNHDASVTNGYYQGQHSFTGTYDLDQGNPSLVNKKTIITVHPNNTVNPNWRVYCRMIAKIHLIKL